MKKLVVAAAVAALFALVFVWSSNTKSASTADIPMATRATRQLAPAIHGDAGLDARPHGDLRLEGQVVDDRDQPVAGAVVTLVDPRETVVSGDDGAFAFEALPANYYQLDAVSGEDRYAPVASITLSANSEPVILKLRPAASLLIRVSDGDTHEQLAGAAVSAWSQVLDAESAGRRTITDGEGVAHLHGLGLGSTVRVRVRGTGYESRELTLAVDLDPKALNEFAVSMHRGVAAGGSIRDASGAPVADQIVSIESLEGRSEATTDVKGHWHADALAAGRHLFYTSGDAKLEERIVELDGVHSKLDIDFALPAPRPREGLRGVTVDEAGRPVAGAKVVAHVYNPFGYDYQTSDSEGRFTANVFPGQDVSIHASAGEQSSDELKIPATARGQSVRLEMKRLVIEGHVRDREGKPVAGAEVVAGPSTVSDAGGHFVLSGLSQQPYTLHAQRRGALPGGTAPTVTARPGDHDVVLIAPDLGTISGQLTLDGSLVTMFSVSVDQANQKLRGPTLVVSTDGRFEAPYVPSGAWQIEFSGPSFRTKLLDVTTTGGDLDLGAVAVDRGQRVHGRVIDSRGSPVGSAIVQVSNHQPFFFESPFERSVTKTDASGSFDLSGVAPSPTNRISATHPTLGTSGWYNLDEHASAIDLVIAASATISGEADRGIQYYLDLRRTDDPSFEMRCMVDWTRRFSCAALQPGDYVLSAEGVAIRPKHVTLHAGDDLHIDMVIATPVMVVVDGLTGCDRLSLQANDGAHEVLSTASCSRPTLLRIPPGEYRLCADAVCGSATVAPSPDVQHVQAPH